MRIFKTMIVAVLALGLAPACAYDLEGDEARFGCKIDADCTDGQICGGHALIDKDAISYCVDEEMEVGAIGLRIKDAVFNCPAFDSAALKATWLAKLTVTTDASGAVTSPAVGTSLSGLGAGCDESSVREGGDTTCCIGGPDIQEEAFDGRASILCFFPLVGVTQAVLVLEYTGDPSGVSIGTAMHSAAPAAKNRASIMWNGNASFQLLISGQPIGCPQ